MSSKGQLRSWHNGLHQPVFGDGAVVLSSVIVDDPSDTHLVSIRRLVPSDRIRDVYCLHAIDVCSVLEVSHRIATLSAP